MNTSTGTSRPPQDTSIITSHRETTLIHDNPSHHINRMLFHDLIHQFIEFSIMRSNLTMRQFMTHGPCNIIIGIKRVILGMPQSQMYPIDSSHCEIVAQYVCWHGACFSTPLCLVVGLKMIEAIGAATHFGDGG